MELANWTVPGGGTNVSSGVGEGASTELAGAGVLRFAFSARRSAFRSAAAISSNRGLTTKKNIPARAPVPSRKNRRIPATIHGNFDFFCAATGCCGKGVEGAGAAIAGAGCGALISPVVDASAAGDGGGGGGGGVGCGGCLAMSDVFGAPAGPVVGPVLRGSATVAG